MICMIYKIAISYSYLCNNKNYIVTIKFQWYQVKLCYDVLYRIHLSSYHYHHYHCHLYYHHNNLNYYFIMIVILYFYYYLYCLSMSYINVLYSTNSDETAVAVYGLFAMGKEIFISIRES